MLKLYSNHMYSQLCGSTSANEYGMIVPNLQETGEGQTFCKTLSGEMFVPKTEIAFQQLLNETYPDVLEKCLYPSVPYTLNGDRKWVDQNGNSKPNELKWVPSEPNGGGLQNCMVLNHDYAAYDVFCDYPACPLCKWTQNPVLLLKGLCEDVDIEYRYVLEIGVTHNSMLVFKGFNALYILFDVTSDCWLLSKTLNTSDTVNIIGTQVSENPTPIGLQNWKMMDKHCNGVMSLKMSSVRFT